MSGAVASPAGAEAWAKEAAEAELRALVADALGSAGPFDAAQKALEDARHRRQAAEAALAGERSAADDARRRLPALIEDAVAGRPVGREAVDAAHRDAEAHERAATFWAAVIGRLAEEIATAEVAVKAALAARFVPVFERGRDMRIAAGAEVDRARAQSRWGMNTSPSDITALKAAEISAVAAARAGFIDGTRLIHEAVKNGVPMPPGRGWVPDWPVTEASERSHWGRA